MEEEFIQNQERLKPTEEKTQVVFSFFFSLSFSSGRAWQEIFLIAAVSTRDLIESICTSPCGMEGTLSKTATKTYPNYKVVIAI